MVIALNLYLPLPLDNTHKSAKFLKPEPSLSVKYAEFFFKAKCVILTVDESLKRSDLTDSSSGIDGVRMTQIVLSGCGNVLAPDLSIRFDCPCR